MEFCRTLSFLEVEFNNLILTDHECLKELLVFDVVSFYCNTV